MEEKKVWLEVPRFTGENVPVNVAARVMKKDPQCETGNHPGITHVRSCFQERRK